MFYSLDEFVADMAVNSDATHAQSEHTQRVLVIVGQRAVADCEKEKVKLKKTKRYEHDFKESFLHLVPC